MASSGEKNTPGTLWAIPRRNSPAACGMVARAINEPAPADWPTTVTVSGSPPKPAMFSCTQPRAATWSSRPRLSGRPGDRTEPLEADAVVERDEDDPVGDQPASVEGGVAGMAVQVGAAVDPHQHGPRSAIGPGRVDVDRQAVEPVRRRPWRLLGEMRRLRGPGPEVGRIAHPSPRRRRRRWPEPQPAEGRRRIGDPAEPPPAFAVGEAPHRARHGLDHERGMRHGDQAWRARSTSLNRSI